MNLKPKTAMLLAAGLGTRLGSLTSHKPKALLEINGRSLLEINLRKLEWYGYNRVVINTHHFHEQIEAFVQQFRSRMEIIISHEPHQPFETGGGLLNALNLLGNGNILVHNVDVLTDLDLQYLHNALHDQQAMAALAVSHRQSSRNLLFDNDMCLSGWSNTSTGEVRIVQGREPRLSFAFSAISVINIDCLQELPVSRISLIDLLLQLAGQNKIVAVIPPQTYWFDVGKAEQLPDIENALKTISI